MSKLITKMIDLGNYNIKLSEDIKFISSYIEFDGADTSESNILEFNGKKYAMEFENDFDGEFNKVKKSYEPNLLWALDKSGAKDGDAYRLVLGLPLNNLGQAQTLKDNLIGKDFTYTTNSTKTIHIEDVVVVGEGISSYYMLPATDREKDLIIIDLGGRTANVVEYKNKRVVNKDTLNIGMIDFYGDIKVKFNNEEGQNVETYQVKHLIDTGVIEQYKTVEDALVNTLMNKVKVKFNIGLGKQIVFTGGGSLTLRNALERYNKNFKFIDNPLYSNVKGNLKIAKAKGWV